MLLVVAAPPAPADARQEAPPADTAAAEADTGAAEAAVSDTPAASAPSFPDRLVADTGRTAARVETWGREDLLDSSALSLYDFLLDHAAGVLPLQAGLSFGPHHLVDGPWGPGAVRVVVDGRELPPTASGQPDLSRISLARVERIRLIRRAGEAVLEVSTLDHEGEEAYSRISAGTGQPGADGIRALFTNGAGDDFVVQGALDYLNVGAGEAPGNRLDAWARVGWMPLDERDAGLELIWRSEGVERSLGERSETFDRRDLFLHARATLTEGLQADLWAGRSSRDPRPDFFPEEPPDDTVPSDTVPSDTLPSDTLASPPGAYEARQLSGSVAYRGEELFLAGTVTSWGGRGQPEISGDLRGELRLGSVVAEASVEATSWPEASTSGWSVGLAYRPAWWEEGKLRAEAATGSRSAPSPGRPAGASRVHDYEALSVGADASVGPYRLSATVSRRSLSRQLRFDGFFDRDRQATGELSLTDFEARARGPLVPWGFFGDHVRVRGFWRYSRGGERGLPFFVPNVLVRGEGILRHTFFDENLEVRLVGRAVHRGAMNSVRPGEAEPVTLPPETSFRSEVVIRIDTFRIWWRADNVRGGRADFGGLPAPGLRNVFGIRWEFFE